MTESAADSGNSTKAVGRRIRKIMSSKTITAQQLSDEIAKLNPSLNWTPSVVMNLTSGRRRFLTLEELYALAMVLNVHPIDLMVPGDIASAEPFELAPGVAPGADLVRNWVAGRDFLSPPESLGELAEAVRWMPKARASALAREWWTPEREEAQNRQLNRELFEQQEKGE